MMNSYIFSCTSKTKQECFDKKLFGAPERQIYWVKEVRPGNILFLYDYSSKKLLGIFEATSRGDLNIEPNAWNGKFPAQVKVKLKSIKIIEIPKKKFEKIVEFSDRHPQRTLSPKQVDNLLALFSCYERKLKGYIYWCKYSTEKECFDRMLFGGKERHEEITKKIKPGDILFLYNLSDMVLHGPFEAIEGGHNLIPEAWGGRFPYQVRVKKLEMEEVYKRARGEIEGILPFFGIYPKVELSYEELRTLINVMRTAKILPPEEEEFREKFKPRIRCDDGHVVRSRGEAMIDNWLFHNYYPHAYERRLPIVEDNVYCDFYVKTPKGECYIEYWGLEDEKYLDRKSRKKEIYDKYGFPLVEITNDDLDRLDDILPQKIGHLKEFPKK